MRWENDTDYLPEASAQSWSKRSDGNFGGRSILESNVYGRNPLRQDISVEDETLMHFGIPGMHWGVITKEYVKKGYNTLARRQAILKRQRQAKAKEEQRRNFEEGYRQGQKRASDTYFIKKRVQSVLDKKQRQEEGTFSDRLVKKGFKKALKNKEVNKLIDQLNETTQNFGVDAHKLVREKGEEYLLKAKDMGVDAALNWMDSDKGRESLQKVANFLSRGTSSAIGVGLKTAPKIARGIRQGRRAAKIGMKEAGKFVLRSAKTSYHWLHTGKPTGAQRIRAKANQIGSTLNKGINRGFDSLDRGAREAHRLNQLGHEKLKILLNKRPKRRG